MSNPTRLLLIFLLFSLTQKAAAQVFDGYDADSLIITFDTLNIDDLTADSSGIWQIGNTTKTFFTLGSTPVRSIMTDTINHYPVNANAWFQIGFNNQNSHYNTTINFRHKYQTDSLHDGCIVEFSTDTGTTWENVLGDCNGDGGWNYSRVRTNNLYSSTDTLVTGEQAFSGTSNGWINSRIQFFLYLPVKSTDSSHLCQLDQPLILLRFRFVSDSIPDSLDGWIIDGIKIENDMWSGVYDVQRQGKLNVHPNPNFDGLVFFPELSNDARYQLEIINSFGQTILRGKYREKVDLREFSKGLYYYRVTSDQEEYNGKILME